MSEITSISLDPESARLAQRMKREGKNFSKFVRECLHLYYRDESQECIGTAIEWLDCDPFCKPERKHFCRACWPAGPPDLADLAKARSHVAQLRACRSNRTHTVLEKDLIEGLWTRDDRGTLHFQLEPAVVEWLQDRAERHNRFIMPLSELDLVGNAKPAKTEKPKKSLIKRILSKIAR